MTTNPLTGNHWNQEILNSNKTKTRNMKAHNTHYLLAALLGVVFTAESHAQTSAFTYQGQLIESGVSVTGLYDFRFRLASDPLGNNYFGGPFLTNALPVTGGLFQVAVDFGAGVFTGSNCWLQVDVKTNGGGAYTTLTPLQALTPTPYATFANTASNLAGALPASQLSGPVPSANLGGTYSGTVTFDNVANSISGDGAGLTGLNASGITSGTVPDAR